MTSTAPPARPRDDGAAPARNTTSASRDRSQRPLRPVLVVLVLGLGGTLLLGLSFGSARIPLTEVWGILLADVIPGLGQQDVSAMRQAIVIESRLPRVLLSMVVGACLAVAGAVAQAVTRNPLADPYLLGVSAGAGFGVVTVVVLGFGVGAVGAYTLPLAAFLGALVPLLLVLLLSGAGRDATMLILLGVAVGQIFQALITFALLVIADDHEIAGVLHWQAGGFGDARWGFLPAPTLSLVLVATVVILGARWLNLLQVGDEGAGALGMNVQRFRLLMLVAVSLLTGTAVAVAGGIGFIGLIVPHAAVFLVGSNARRSIPVAALVGALALALADLVARALTPATEFPVGVVTALVGAPVFVYMLYRRRRKM
ncbi:iron ABC transporter permease [Lipingzhangella sp. LS1_29]|uniref:Iron ABC transporter permease n=1 Tax=Lipingzhangella rawalii TaxID=2055835 RepID=A0ABU2H2M3_9ACTN|nr:iron ABC transporter permease [Lipingzhangella rawalii]MDS1269541.1 iron ABC transporter permease [Lipingzhangella rawalii]